MNPIHKQWSHFFFQLSNPSNYPSCISIKLTEFSLHRKHAWEKTLRKQHASHSHSHSHSHYCSSGNTSLYFPPLPFSCCSRTLTTPDSTSGAFQQQNHDDRSALKKESNSINTTSHLRIKKLELTKTTNQNSQPQFSPPPCKPQPCSATLAFGSLVLLP